MICLNAIPVVGSVALTGQTAALSQTIFTPTTFALYRFTLALYWTNPSSPGAHATISWTLGGGGDDISGGIGVVTTTDFVDSGSAVTLTVTYSGTGSYSVYAIVEQLS